MSREPFDLSDLKLNLENGQQTSWGNLGYWRSPDGKPILDYPSAATELAHRHAVAAQIGPQTRLLDLAFGCGDQLLLWQQAYGVEQISAANLSASQTQFAQQKLQAAAQPTAGIRLQQADAVAFLRQQTAHSFDAIVVVDGAYHFSPWGEFIALACSALAPGGRLVISTLGLPVKLPWWQQLRTRPSLALAGISSISLDTEATLNQLQANGMQPLEIEDMTEPVLAGFCQWWPRYADEYASNWPKTHKLRYQLTSHWLATAIQRGWPKYQLLTAVKR